jgi:4-hydroxybenzoate polyprenyltransferase
VISLLIFKFFAALFLLWRRALKAAGLIGIRRNKGLKINVIFDCTIDHITARWKNQGRPSNQIDINGKNHYN